jgi:hypothetical protein
MSYIFPKSATRRWQGPLAAAARVRATERRVARGVALMPGRTRDNRAKFLTGGDFSGILSVFLSTIYVLFI